MDQTSEQNLELIAIIAGFALLMAVHFALRKRLRKRALIRQGQLPGDGVRIPTIEERVAANRSWSGGKIRSRGLTFVILSWIGALVWNLTFGVAFVKSFSNPEIKIGGSVVLGILAALGLVAVAFAVRFTMRQLRFGNSWCCITGKAGVLGKPMTGYIRTSSNVEAIGEYEIQLQCIETYYTGSGKNRRTQANVLWQGSQKVSHAGRSSVAGIPFSIDLPSTSPETGHQLSRGTVHWQLTARAPVKGVDYAAHFIVPVFQMS